MAKAFQPQVATANDLLTGDVVYLAADGEWTRELAGALVARTPDDAQAILAQADQPAKVVGAYLVAVEPGLTGPRPSHFRERFRLLGPSVRADFRNTNVTGPSTTDDIPAGII